MMNAGKSDAPDGGASKGEVAAIWVVAALIRDEHGRVLLQQRPAGKAHGGLWEFPGGKVEPGELPGAALIREIDEELGLALTQGALEPVAFAEGAPDAAGRAVVLLLYAVGQWEGAPYAREGGAFAWAEPAALHTYPMPPLDIELLSRIPWKNFSS